MGPLLLPHPPLRCSMWSQLQFLIKKQNPTGFSADVLRMTPPGFRSAERTLTNQRIPTTLVSMHLYLTNYEIMTSVLNLFKVYEFSLSLCAWLFLNIMNMYCISIMVNGLYLYAPPPQLSPLLVLYKLRAHIHTGDITIHTLKTQYQEQVEVQYPVEGRFYIKTAGV